jgi:hypothetical protein
MATNMTNAETTVTPTPSDTKPIIHTDHVSYDWNAESKLDVSVPVLTCKVAISPGVYLYGAACGNHFWIGTDPINTYTIQYYSSRTQRNDVKRDAFEVDPFFTVEALGNAHHQMVSTQIRKPNSYGYSYDYVTVQKPDSYGSTYDYTTRQDTGGFPYNYLKVKVTFMGESVEEIFKFKQPEAGEVDIDANGSDPYTFVVNTSFFGLNATHSWNVKGNNSNSYSYSYRRDQWQKAWKALTTCTFKQDVNAFLIRFFQAHTTNDSRALKGIEKRKEIKPVLARLEKEEPLLWAFYSFLKNGRVVKKMSNNRLLASVLLDCGKNYKKFKKQLEIVLRDTLETDPGSHYDMESATRVMCMRFPTAIKADAQARSKAEWNLREGLSNQAQGLGIHPRRHKMLMRAIAKKQISLSIFHTTGDPLNLINAEFDLWERALRRKDWAEVIYSICNAITNKNRFEKHITPYLSFLFRVEKYLKRHTGRNWTAFPKLVNSEAQLEMQERDENGTVKTRSALTPIADNEKNTITVPYAGLKMYGAQTTYCYSKHYFVFEKDTIDEVSGSVVVNELEKKLNGRDDYGLMYYTLDGSVEAQGYPTFLIIFERRKHTPTGELKPYTFVHFHRVHPSRKKNGRMVPACRLVEECYRYMAGNVRAEEIFAQQGDLIFIKADKPSDFKDEEGKAVAEFESHRFATGTNPPVKLWPNESKSIKNRLGFINSDHDFVLEHPEHEHVPFTAGYYEIRRCKSWEANPSAVWSYTFD